MTQIGLLDGYVDELKKMVDTIFKSPPPTRDAMVISLFRFLSGERVHEYETERIMSYLAGPCVVGRAKGALSPLQMYLALDNDRKEKIAEYFNTEFQATGQRYPEEWNHWQRESRKPKLEISRVSLGTTQV